MNIFVSSFSNPLCFKKKKNTIIGSTRSERDRWASRTERWTGE